MDNNDSSWFSGWLSKFRERLKKIKLNRIKKKKKKKELQDKYIKEKVKEINRVLEKDPNRITRAVGINEKKENNKGLDVNNNVSKDKNKIKEESLIGKKNNAINIEADNKNIKENDGPNIAKDEEKIDKNKELINRRKKYKGVSNISSNPNRDNSNLINQEVAKEDDNELIKKILVVL